MVFMVEPNAEGRRQKAEEANSKCKIKNAKLKRANFEF
jgi:hypothetical protein